MDLKEVDRVIERGMARARTPGVAFGLLRPGRRPIVRGYGYRNREEKLPVTPRTMFGIASVTKSFTALAVLRLAEHGLLRVSDPVTRHLPELRVRGASARRPIRLHHLLTHTSGLPPLPSIYYTSMRSLRHHPPYDRRVARRVGIDPDRAPIDTYDQLTHYLSRERYRLLAPPGTVYSYSNEGFGLLGAVVERASGQHYENFLEQEILRPAGMTSTVFDPGILFREPEVTTLYSPRWTGTRHSLTPSEDWWEDACMRGAGALRTNVTDLLRYLEVFLHAGRVEGERVVSPPSVAEMMRPHASVRRGEYYGYGLFVRPDYHGTLLVSHSGGLRGISSLIAVAPRRGVAGAVLSNAEGAPVERFLVPPLHGALGLPRRFLFDEMPRAAPPSAPMASYAGWYCSGEGIWVECQARRDHLRLDFRGIEAFQKNLRLTGAGGDEFIVRHGGEADVVRFLRDETGRVSALFLGSRVLRKRTRAERSLAARGRLVW